MAARRRRTTTARRGMGTKGRARVRSTYTKARKSAAKRGRRRY